MCLLEFYLVIKIKFMKFRFEMRIYVQKKCFFKKIVQYLQTILIQIC